MTTTNLSSPTVKAAIEYADSICDDPFASEWLAAYDQYMSEHIEEWAQWIIDNKDIVGLKTYLNTKYPDSIVYPTHEAAMAAAKAYLEEVAVADDGVSCDGHDGILGASFYWISDITPSAYVSVNTNEGYSCYHKKFRYTPDAITKKAKKEQDNDTTLWDLLLM